MTQKQTPIISPNGSEPIAQPEPEVVPRAVRRSFSAAYKLRIVEEAEQCTEHGQIGATDGGNILGDRSISNGPTHHGLEAW